VLPAARTRYLAEISDTVRGYKARARAQGQLAREIQQLRAAAEMLEVGKPGKARAAEAARDLAAQREQQQDGAARQLLAAWPALRQAYSGTEYVVTVRDKEIRTALTTTSLSGTEIRKVSLPTYHDQGDILQWLMLDNLPGNYPYTAGTFAFKRQNEDPTRMFAGEGDAFRTNTRFKLLSDGMPAKRLSTAFDSVTLYGNDPDPRPDIYGKVGNSGVSIATLDDMKVLYGGFDLCSPSTSVSMTINGPAPTILAMFMNTAIDQKMDALRAELGTLLRRSIGPLLARWALEASHHGASPEALLTLHSHLVLVHANAGTAELARGGPDLVGGFDHLLMMMQAGFLDHERTCKNIRLFAKDVYPAIKDLAGTRPLDLPIAAE
jgi:methylmalonyl-CoA mutase